jgi:hypothetical protein
VQELAEREGISINQLINSAVVKKISALLTREYLEDHAKRGSRRKFEKVISKVKEKAPGPEDRLDS